MTTMPEEPWERVAFDFNGPHSEWGDKSVFVMVEYHARFLVAEFLRSTDFNSVKPVMDRTFDLMCYPRTLGSDNGTPFQSGKWDKHAADKGFTIEHSAPLDPQQNGVVERYMQLVNDEFWAR
ncbi:MAG: DDE-type integrase/transposase/recombinase [Propionibacteriaceae bacterium]